MVLDLKLHGELCDHSVVQISTIVCDDPFGDALPTDKVMFNEPDDHIFSNRGERGCFNPLCEVINGEEDEVMSVGSSRV